MESIHFFSEEIKFQLPEKRKTRLWISTVIEKEEYKCGEINYIFCSDEYLYQINMEYLGHNTYTDIVTFDMSEEDEMISGDIFISVERAKENAREFGQKLGDEMLRLMVHGLLHLIGYDDKKEDKRLEMREKEDEYIGLYKLI